MIASSGKSLNLSARTKLVLLVILLLLGTALRIYRFPALPVGLHQDEISEAYESYCLLHTGADRWGYHLPVYFLSWGSGQNVLQSYLSIPVIAVTGLSRVGARLIPLLCGLGTLPLFFFSVRRWNGEIAAFASLLFLAICPWHVMLTRWGIENSPLPFFMILGIFTFGAALQSRSAWIIVPSLLPFALALYTYGVVVVVMPGLLFFLLLIGFRSISQEWRKWLAASGCFLALSLPIAFFLLKNYVTKKNYAFEKELPFSVPLIPITRLSQIQGEVVGQSPLHHNLHFLAHGLVDNIAWFQVPGIPPLPGIVLGLALLGIGFECWKVVRQRRLCEPFLPWLVACIPLLVLFPLNISRAIPLFVPLIALAGVGFAFLFSALSAPGYRVALTCGCAAALLVPTAKFVHAYFGGGYSAAIAPTFYPELPAAMEEVRRRSGGNYSELCSDAILHEDRPTDFSAFGCDLHQSELWTLPIQPRLCRAISQASGVSFDCRRSTFLLTAKRHGADRPFLGWCVPVKRSGGYL
jgi:hypothetical protein